jgi:hypothetical protein
MPAPPTRPRGRPWRALAPRRPGREAGTWQLGVSLLLAACAIGPPSGTVEPGPLRVRIGQIDPAALEAAATEPPRELRSRTDYLVDLLWQVGCAAVEMPRPDDRRSSDVVCSLPGRTPDRIVVLAHLDRKVDESGMPRHWRGVALLPFLYQALGVEERQHSFEFAALGNTPPRRFGEYRKSLPPPRGEGVRAVVEILDLDPMALAFASADAGLSQDFVSTGLAVGLPLDSLIRLTGYRVGRLAGAPTIAIASPPGSGGRDELPGVAASPGSGPATYHTAARLVAVYLGYLDETLRLRAPAAPPAEAGAP